MADRRALCVAGAASWSVLSVLILLGGASNVHAQADGAGSSSASAAGLPPAAATVLRLARSADGHTFTSDGKVLFSGASAPDLTLLPNGDLLLVADFAKAEDSVETVLAVVKARGRTLRWTKPRRLRFEGSGKRLRNARHGSVVVESSRRMRLYFTVDAPAPTRRDRRAAGRAVIRSAISATGLAYRIGPSLRIRTDDYEDAHATAIRHDGRTHLYVVGEDADTGSTTTHPSTAHFVSDTGDRFARLSPVETPDALFRGCVVKNRRGMRAYVTTETGIASARSRDGRRWKAEPGLRLAGGWDPAVVRLKDGSYLMVYCDKLDSSATASSMKVTAEWVDESGEEADGVVVVDSEMADGQQGFSDDAEAALKAAEDSVGDESEIDDSEMNSGGSTIDGVSAIDAEQHEGDGAIEVQDDAAGEVLAEDAGSDASPVTVGAGFPEPDRDWKDGWDPESYDGFAPPPDFLTQVDYIEWHRDYAVEVPVDNAYNDYAAAFALARDADGEMIPINDMFCGGEILGSTRTWKPEDRPEWEATSQKVAPWLEKYRAANLHEGFSRPLDFMDDEGGIDKAYGPLLMGLMLPDLSSHRQLAKAILADAWRVREDGRPSPDRMMEAWETVYRSATHLEHGTTLIEDLVSVAERALVQDTARRALKEGVFRSTEELQQAFDTLREFDRTEEDPSDSLRGEHAFAMDITQYLFSPPTADGLPKPNPDRLDALPDWGGDYEALREQVSGMTPDDVYDTIDSFDQYYRELGEQLRIGYPDVRGSDVAATAERLIHTSPLTEAFLPALSRVHQLKAREETSRRATQLAYATELFRRREGRFPSSLAELPAEYGDDIRIDPFSGRHFGYKLTKDGPRIWSASEDGVSSGGVHAPRWADRPDPETGSDDHVFWPVQPK